MSRLCISTLLLPVVISILSGCTTGRLVPIASQPLTQDRMMAIGETFERQGRFAQAQSVYQQILEQDPVSPAAERLLAVIAAADVINARDLPVERLMSVGEFYERHGNVTLAQGIYTQILDRQPDFSPARERLEVIAAHGLKHAGKSSRLGKPFGRMAANPYRGPSSGAGAPAILSPLNVVPAGRSLTPVSDRPLPLPAVDPSTTELFQAADSTLGAVDVNVASAAVVTPAVNEFASTPRDVPESNELEVAINVAVAESDSSSIQLVGAEEIAAQQLPPSPSELPYSAPQPVPSIAQKSAPQQSVGGRAMELWQDRPLGELKASISMKFPESENLRESERERLTLAAPHMAARGSVSSGIGQSRPWMLASYEWEAPATRHLPLWFEEPNLERMGYTYGLYWNIWGYESGPVAAECLQPFVSGAHFWGRVAAIPYMCGVDPPCEPIYTLGVDRPGSPVPYRKHLVPISLKGALYQAGAVVGFTYLLP